MSVNTQRSSRPIAVLAAPHLTLSQRAGLEICPVYFWEDDGQDI